MEHKAPQESGPLDAATESPNKRTALLAPTSAVGSFDWTIRRLGASVVLLIILRMLVITHNYDMWGIFHYYLGAKYFPQVGYTSLYSCALEADDEAGGANRYWVHQVRDLSSYRIIPRANVSPCPRSNFNTQEWQTFTTDFEQTAELSNPAVLGTAFTDKGFNPPPSWVLVAKPFVTAVGALHGRANTVIFNLDLIAFAIGIFLVWHSAGTFSALLSASLAVFYFGNFGHIGGNFLQYLWFPFLVAAVVLWRVQKPLLSGTALGVAVGLQAFPIFFALPLLAQGAIRILRGFPREKWSQHRMFAIGLAIVLLASFGAGCCAGRGVAGWREWKDKISVHRHYLDGEIFNVGLPNLTATLLKGNESSATNYVTDYPNTVARLNALKSSGWIYGLAGLSLLAVIVWRVGTSETSDVFAYGFLVMYAVTSSSPYYYFSLVLIPFMFWNSPVLRNYATIGATVLVAGHALFFPIYVSFSYVPHLLSELSIALFLIGALVFPAVEASSSKESAIPPKTGPELQPEEAFD
ncbi:MAG TPA: hypothetical protein VN577_08945 [Terriglobales bacterium]|nr:hypothetical protein [Terriglobales bacterium]